jgi:hypothetical protein
MNTFGAPPATGWACSRGFENASSVPLKESATIGGLNHTLAASYEKKNETCIDDMTRYEIEPMCSRKLHTTIRCHGHSVQPYSLF